MNRFIIEYKLTAFNYMMAFAVLGFAFYAPINFFDENGPVEILESFALLASSILCFIEYKKNRNFKSVFLVISIIFLFFIGREMSWGRVFFFDDAGHVIKRRDWFLGPYIYYIIAPFAIATIAYAYKTKFVSNFIILLKKAPIMFLDFLLVILMISISIISESSIFPKELSNYRFAIEESAEIAMYLAVALIIRNYSKKNLLNGIKEKSRLK